MRHDPERIRGLVEMRRPETFGELALLERKLKGTTCTTRVEISGEDW